MFSLKKSLQRQVSQATDLVGYTNGCSHSQLAIIDFDTNDDRISFCENTIWQDRHFSREDGNFLELFLFLLLLVFEMFLEHVCQVINNICRENLNPIIHV